MSDKSKIEWTDSTWNPVTGCSKVSQGCKHCYAERDWTRLSANSKTVYFGRKFTEVMRHPERLAQPLKWKKPRRIFVNSMSDLFHEDVPFEFIASVFSVMSVTTRHTYQVLTKRPERMLEFFKWAMQWQDIDGKWYTVKSDDFVAGDRISDHWPKHINWENCGYDNCGPAFPYRNVWLGVSVEDQETADARIPLLLQTPAAVRWISAEPLLGEIQLGRLQKQKGGQYRNALTGEVHGFYTDYKDCQKLDWVVAGGESGPRARPSSPDWFRSLRDQCQSASVPFHFKQWGEYTPLKDDTLYRTTKKKAGRVLDGCTHDEYPA